MPFKSEAQRRYMHKNLPEIAVRWEAEYGSSDLPKRIKPKTKLQEKRRNRRKGRRY
tara:strand:+ start:4257 stop:4424 length:168 start_codon:yes stop_codon:yes gene_type:complete